MFDIKIDNLSSTNRVHLEENVERLAQHISEGKDLELRSKILNRL